MRVLALDVGSKLGWATDATGRLEFGTEDFRIRNGESSGNRWRRFGEWLNDASTWTHHAEPDRLYKVDLIIYERAVFMPKARAAAEIAAGFTTRLEEHCERHGIALEPVAVQTLKAYALPKVPRKKGDPKMDRSKAAMIKMATAKLATDLKAKCESVIGVAVPPLTEHEADALWLYWMAKERNG